MNITNVSIENFGDFLSLINQEVYGAFGLGILLMFFTVGFVYLSKRYNIPVSIFLSLTLCLPLATVLVLLNFLDMAAFYAYVLLLSLSGVFAMIRRSG